MGMQNKNSWEILGIAKNAGRTDIKRAYAGLVKQFHPEDDSEGFAIIRNAYETVLAELERKNNNTTPEPTTGAISNICSKINGYDFGPMQQWNEKDLNSKIDIVIGRMEEIYEIIEFRRDRNNWEICFHLETCKAIMYTEKFSLAFLHFLDTHRNFPCHMWRYLHAETDLLNLLDIYSDNFEELRVYVFSCVFDVPVEYCNTFDYLRSSTPLKTLEAYIEITIKIQLLFSLKDTAAALEAFYLAIEFISNDLELYKITQKYLIANALPKEAEKIYGLQLALN